MLGRAPLGILLSVCLLGAAQGQEREQEIPPHPETSEWLWDRADLVNAEDGEAIEAAQVRVGRAHSTAIIVVTIEKMSDYSDASPTIEQFAMDWFNAWEIGSRDYNTGILLLVSRSDRKARIELGGLWGHKWDGYCQRVMNRDIIPRFKEKDFSGGIRDGVAALEVMAGIGPNGAPPEPGVLEQLENTELVRTIRAHQPLPMWLATISFVAGVGLCVAAIFFPDHRKLLLIVGALLILIGVTVWLLVIIAGAFMKGSGQGGSSGFGGGGSSGGGGASGSW